MISENNTRQNEKFNKKHREHTKEQNRNFDAKTYND